MMIKTHIKFSLPFTDWCHRDCYLREACLTSSVFNYKNMLQLVVVPAPKCISGPSSATWNIAARVAAGDATKSQLSTLFSVDTQVKVDSEKSLHEFLEKDLKLPPSRSSVIPREVQLSHVLSLYKRLTWHKAVIFVKQGHDPYKEALSSSKFSCHSLQYFRIFYAFSWSNCFSVSTSLRYTS